MTEQKKKPFLLTRSMNAWLVIGFFALIGYSISGDLHLYDLPTRLALSGLLLGMSFMLLQSLGLSATYKQSKTIRKWRGIEKVRLGIFVLITTLWLYTSQSSETLVLYAFALIAIMVHKEILGKQLKEESKSYAFSEIDQMNPTEFQTFIGKMYEGLGYQTETITSAEGKKKDVMIVKKKTKTVLQTTCYPTRKKVRVEAIRTLLAEDWKVDKKMMISNQYFTKSAIHLAHRYNVTLIDRDGLQFLLSQYRNEKNQASKKDSSSVENRSSK